MNGPTMNTATQPVQPLYAEHGAGRSGVQAAPGLDAGGVWLDCPVCGLDGGPYGAAEAGQLGGTHDDLIHHGHPTALVLAGSRAGSLAGSVAGGAA
jgi:hypothetical protein